MMSLSSQTIEWIGVAGATLTTLSWLPQTIKTISTKQTRDISLGAQVLLLSGIILWLIYGFFIMSWPLIGSNIVTFVLVGIILILKLRHG